MNMYIFYEYINLEKSLFSKQGDICKGAGEIFSLSLPLLDEWELHPDTETCLSYNPHMQLCNISWQRNKILSASVYLHWLQGTCLPLLRRNIHHS